MPKVLEINNLSKNYGRIKAVDQASFSVEKGQVFGILGPNGSGKTTTLGIILDVIQPSEGSYQWFEEPNSHQQRKKIGSILETPNFYPYLSAVNNLKIVADIKGIDYSDIERVLKVTNLVDRKDDKFKTYSLGMKQRMSIASALLGDPEVLVLDEPTNGLDPQGIAEVRNLIIELGNQGKTIILASHLLDEVEKVCTHAAVLKKGKFFLQVMSERFWVMWPKVEIAAADNELLKSLA
jgi:ABC-type multidrug transport system ATPase subunit